MKSKKIVYQFDLEGKLINTFESTREAGRELNLVSVSRYINRNSCIRLKFYLSYDINFKITRGVYSHNPLYSKGMKQGNDVCNYIDNFDNDLYYE